MQTAEVAQQQQQQTCLSLFLLRSKASCLSESLSLPLSLRNLMLVAIHLVDIFAQKVTPSPPHTLFPSPSLSLHLSSDEKTYLTNCAGLLGPVGFL